MISVCLLMLLQTATYQMRTNQILRLPLHGYASMLRLHHHHQSLFKHDILNKTMVAVLIHSVHMSDQQSCI